MPVLHAHPPLGGVSDPTVAPGDVDVAMPAVDSSIMVDDAADGTFNGNSSSVAPMPHPAPAAASRPPTNGSPLPWAAVAAGGERTVYSHNENYYTHHSRRISISVRSAVAERAANNHQPLRRRLTRATVIGRQWARGA